jgi:ERCC4-related helicase
MSLSAPSSTSKFISHPLLKDGVVERRKYQLDIAKEATKGSLMVVLPTGLGKTTVALLVLVNRLATGKILFLAPTRPLVEQHAAFLKKKP